MKCITLSFIDLLDIETSIDTKKSELNTIGKSFLWSVNLQEVVYQYV